MKTIKIISIGLLLVATTGVAVAQDTNGSGVTAANDQQTITQSAQQKPDDNGGSYYDWEVGFRLMPVFSSLDVRTVDNGVVQTKLGVGYGFGFNFGYNFTEHVGLQTELMYNTLTQRWRDRSLDRKLRLNYINVPILLSLNTGKDKMANLNVVLGPQFGMNVGSHFDGGGSGGVDTVTAVLAVRRADVGFAYGVGGEFKFGAEQNWHFDVGFRGVYGLLDISDQSKSITTNQYYILDRAHVRAFATYVGVTYAF